HLREIHSISINARGKVGELAFSSSQLGSSGTTTLGSGSRSGTLLRERFAFRLQLTSQVGQQRRRSYYVVTGSLPRLLSSLSLQQSMRPAVLDFQPLFFDTHGILSDDTHVTFGPLNFLLE